MPQVGSFSAPIRAHFPSRLPVAHGLSAIEREARRIGPLKLSSNAEGREDVRERFESLLASSFIAAMRTLPAYLQERPRVSQME